jgi:hypothetical protein
MKHNIKLNQWLINKNHLKNIFLYSHFYSPVFFNRSRKYKFNLPFKFYLWFLLKNRYNRFLKKFIYNYKKTGFLTSQFVHFAVQKNITYFVWSKYRSKLFNLNYCNAWFYNSSQQQSLYHKTLIYALYSFSVRPDQPNWSVDGNLNKVSSPYINLTQYKNIWSLKTPRPLMYNPNPNQFNFIGTEYTLSHLLFLMQLIPLIEQLVVELDPNKRVQLQNELNNNVNKFNIDNLSNIIPSHFFIFPTFFLSHDKGHNIEKFFFYVLKQYCLV